MFKKNQIFLNTEEELEDQEERSQGSVTSSLSDYEENGSYQHHNYMLDNESIKEYISTKKKMIKDKKQQEEVNERKKTTAHSLPHKSQNTTINTEVSAAKQFISKNINQINLAEIGQVYESKQAYEDWMNQIQNQKMVKIDFDQQTKKHGGGQSQLNTYFHDKMQRMDNQLLFLKKKIINEQKVQYFANMIESDKRLQEQETKHKKKVDLPYQRQISLDEYQRKKNQEEILKKCEQPEGFFKYKTHFNYLPHNRSPSVKSNNTPNKQYFQSAEKKRPILKENQGKQQDSSLHKIRQYSQTPKLQIDKVFDESFYPRKSHRKESSNLSSYDMSSQIQKQNESPKSTKLMHTLERRLKYLSKVQVKIEGSNTVAFNPGSVLDTQNASEQGVPHSARNSYAKNNQSIDFCQYHSVILPNIIANQDKESNNSRIQQDQLLSTRNQSDQTKRFYLKEEFLDGYSINGSQQFQSVSPASKKKSKFISLRSDSKQKSPTNSAKQSLQTPRYYDISQFLADQDSSICYDQNYESTLSLNYQGKPLDSNQVKQIPSIINELSTMIDGTFKEGKKFDDPKILQTFYKSIRQIVEIDLSHIEEQKLEKNNKNKIQQFNDKIDSLKDKLVKLKEIEDQIAKTLSINDEMFQSQKRLIRIKKQYDKTLDNIDFFMQILEQYDYPQSNTSMIMLKMKQNEYKELIELQQQSASEYRESMLDPTNPANNITAYRYDRIRKIKEFIKQKKIRNAQKLTNV